jgi:hypothetical protein
MRDSNWIYPEVITPFGIRGARRVRRRVGIQTRHPSLPSCYYTSITLLYQRVIHTKGIQERVSQSSMPCEDGRRSGEMVKGVKERGRGNETERNPLPPGGAWMG